MQLIRYNPIRNLLETEKELDKWPIVPVLPEESAVDMYVEDGRLVAEVALPNFTKKESKEIAIT